MIVAIATLLALLAWLAEPAWAQRPGGKPGIRQFRLSGVTATLTAQMDTPCVVTATAGLRSMVTQPQNGSAAFSANGGDLRFTPRRGFVGADEFVYANGAPERPGRQIITVSVVVQRDPPVAAAPRSASAPPGWPVCSFVGSEIGGTSQVQEFATANMRMRAGARCGFNVNLQNVTVQQDTAPTHGTLFVSGLSVTYTAPGGYSGADSFVIRWSRGSQIRRLAVAVEIR